MYARGPSRRAPVTDREPAAARDALAVVPVGDAIQDRHRLGGNWAAVRYNRPAMNYLIIVLLVVIFLVLVGVRVWKRMN